MSEENGNVEVSVELPVVEVVEENKVSEAVEEATEVLALATEIAETIDEARQEGERAGVSLEMLADEVAVMGAQIATFGGALSDIMETQKQILAAINETREHAKEAVSLEIKEQERTEELPPQAPVTVTAETVEEVRVEPQSRKNGRWI